MSSFHTKPIYPKQQNIGMVLWATVELKYIPSSDDVADIFMKSLARSKFEELVPRLGLGVVEEEEIEAGRQKSTTQ